MTSSKDVKRWKQNAAESADTPRLEWDYTSTLNHSRLRLRLRFRLAAFVVAVVSTCKEKSGEKRTRLEVFGDPDRGVAHTVETLSDGLDVIEYWCSQRLYLKPPEPPFRVFPNVLTLFAGGGGADLGLREAGFSHLSCVEGDRSAIETLKAAGFPGVWAWIGGRKEGVSSWSPEWFLRWSSDVDFLWASPPCQPWSRVGKRLGVLDTREGWLATLSTIARVNPRWVIIENVVGAPVERWGEGLEKLGYSHVSWRRLDAADWGLHSHRVRVFLVAGPMEYAWPIPTHSRDGSRRWRGFGEVLDDLPPEYAGRGWGASRPELLLSPSAGVCTTEVKGTRASCSSNYTFNGGPDRASDSLFLATGRRRLTWKECSRLLGFPDDYPFQGTIESKYRQIGNAVAPIMAKVIGEQLKEAMRGNNG